MQYPQWWERLVAGIIDGVIVAVAILIIGTIFGLAAGSSLTAVRLLGFLAALISTALAIGYKVFFEAGKWQATPGKMAMGLQVVDESGQRAPMQQVFLRTWPWWLNLLSALGALLLIGSWAINLLIMLAIIGIFCTFFMPPGGRCIHDATAKMYVIKSGPGLFKTA